MGDDVGRVNVSSYTAHTTDSSICTTPNPQLTQHVSIVRAQLTLLDAVADDELSYTLTFLLLASEMATFCILVAPLPHAVRKKLFRFLSESSLVAKLAYGIKIAFMFVHGRRLRVLAALTGQSRFVAVLFVDALQRMWRVTAEADIARNQGGTLHDARAETNFAARKF